MSDFASKYTENLVSCTHRFLYFYLCYNFFIDTIGSSDYRVYANGRMG